LGVSDLRFVAGPSDAGIRLDKFLAVEERLGSRRRASVAIERGKVFVNDREATPADGGRRLSEGDSIRVWTDRPGSAHRRAPRMSGDALDILYEDDALIVLNKPAGLLAVPLASRSDAASVEEELVHHLRSRGKRRPLVVHRIDRDTSGLVLFAKRADAQVRLKDQFRRHEPERVYLAVVYGRPRPAQGTWRDRLRWDAATLVQKPAHPREIKGTEAVSKYRVLEELDDAALLEITLVTGKRNQIRLQARLHGHQLVGERLYVDPNRAGRLIEFPRQALHAYRLAFKHPMNEKYLRFEAPVPRDLAELVKALKNRPARTVSRPEGSKELRGNP
jgi:23S rRNA pseudouridine1911/1915/1917 synthase